MSRFRDFDAAQAERAGEPLAFRLGGKDFTTVPTLPAGPMLEMARAMADDDFALAFATFARFFEAIVPPEQHDDFAVAVRAADFQTMADLLSWVIEESTGRPLDKPSSSAPSSSGNGASSRLAWATEGGTPS